MSVEWAELLVIYEQTLAGIAVQWQLNYNCKRWQGFGN